MSLSDPIKVMIRVVEVLEKLRIPYYLGGSLASSVYGTPRATQDIDIVADIQLRHVKLFVSSFTEEEFYIDEEMIKEAIASKSSFNIIHLEAMIKVDIFIFNDTSFAQSEMSRRRRELIMSDPESFVSLPTPEDIILQKLLWFNMGGRVSDRQWQDILGVINVQSNKLDLTYLNSWAKKLNLFELLQQALKDAKM